VHRLKHNYCLSDVFKRIKEKFCADNLIKRSPINPVGRPHENTYFSLGHKHLALGNRSFGKRRVAIQPFSKEFRGNFCP
jgi:hypothetical protein